MGTFSRREVLLAGVTLPFVCSTSDMRWNLHVRHGPSGDAGVHLRMRGPGRGTLRLITGVRGRYLRRPTGAPTDYAIDATPGGATLRWTAGVTRLSVAGREDSLVTAWLVPHISGRFDCRRLSGWGSGVFVNLPLDGEGQGERLAAVRDAPAAVYAVCFGEGVTARDVGAARRALAGLGRELHVARVSLATHERRLLTTLLG